MVFLSSWIVTNQAVWDNNIFGGSYRNNDSFDYEHMEKRTEKVTTFVVVGVQSNTSAP